MLTFSFSQLVVEGVTKDASTTASQMSRSGSAAPRTPRPKTASASHASNASKVVEKDFTPRTLKLALAAKSHVRTRTIFDEPFPRNNKISRINFAWRTIKESAIASDENEVRRAYKRAMNDLSAKTKLMKFVSNSLSFPFLRECLHSPFRRCMAALVLLAASFRGQERK